MSKAAKTVNETRYQLLIMAVLSLIVAYIIGSRAIDTGSLWQYGLAIILLITGMKFAFRSLKNITNK